MMTKNTFLWLSERQGVFDFIRGNRLARQAASRFVAGESLDDAIAAARALNDRGIAVSLDLLGESVTDAHQAQQARDEVIQMLDRVGEAGGDTNVSIKLTQMGLDLSDEICETNTRAILERARDLDVFVRIDMEGSQYTERTLRLFYDRLHPEYGNGTGVVIQSYMRRSEEDVDRLVPMQARVRLCKGAYAEPESVAFQERAEVSESFKTLLEKLLRHGDYPAVATHDETLIQHTLDLVNREAISPDRFEFQMLYGVRRDLQDELRSQGFNMRVYVPFGTQWYPYLMRRLAERPANVVFMTASVLKEALSGK